jgi:hypothetical protein
MLMKWLESGAEPEPEPGFDLEVACDWIRSAESADEAKDRVRQSWRKTNEAGQEQLMTAFREAEARHPQQAA